jgi:hypothetical protein
MRHVPTSIYIDTEFFKRQGLRLDNKAFTALTDTFVKGGLRLLVPAMMERELFRHFKREAEKAAEAVVKAHKAYPITNLSIVNIPSQNELEKSCIEEMSHQWDLFKQHFVVESLPIAGNLDDVVDWYFEVLPPFSEKKTKEFPDAFIISALDQYHKQHNTNIAVIGLDGDFIQACAKRRYISHFPDLQKYIEAFQPEISGKDLEKIDLTKPIVTEDLSELKAILGRGAQATSIEIQRAIQLLASRGSNYDYFFKNASKVIWLPYLSEKGYFLNPPEVEITSEGHYLVPGWPPLEYLIRIFDAAPDRVIEEISKIPSTKNFRVLEGIIKIVVKADSSQMVEKFLHHILLFIDNTQWGHELLIELLKKPFIFDAELSEITPAILLKLVEFRPDPRDEEKRARRKENPNEYGASLEPAPRFRDWEYQQIIEKGVRPLAERESYQVARILIDATASMIRLGAHQDDLDKGRDEDYSEIWCRRLDHPDRDYRNSKETLVNTLTYACEQVFDKAPDSVEALDQALRNQRWKIFKRLRQHLYALHLNDQTLAWIREFILGHKDYAKWEHHYEFQLMIRNACEHYGLRLLSEAERSRIFDLILSGPSKEDFREWMGDQYSEEVFRQRKRYFHRKQLRPFAILLIGEYRTYFDELESENQEKPLSDEDFSPCGSTKGGFVSYQSPKSADELAKFADKELLAYINEWDDGHRDKGNWLIEINITALVGVFQSLFKEAIVPDEGRLSFWMAHREHITRPVYIAAMAKAMQGFVKDRNFEKLDQWVEFCDWILQHPDTDRRAGESEPNDESRERPDWGSSRRAVVDFIDVCLNKDANVPLAARSSLAKLLQKLCTQFDWRLDRDQAVLLNRDDQITEAINNTRSRALESLINFGFWVRRYLPDDAVPEVTDYLNERLGANAEIALTKPEHAFLGLHFGNLCVLNKDWARDNKSKLFPQNNALIWREAFGSFLRYSQPTKLTFDMLRQDFELAIDNLEEFDSGKDSRRDLIDRLGQHLFSYYLWEIYPLTGEESLLARFYEKTAEEHQRWAHLFDHVGRSLRNSGKHLEDSLVERVIAFFDWRFEAGEPQELHEFTFWLGAECLKPEWRLEAYSKILDLRQTKKAGLSIEMGTLINLLPDHQAQVVQCFAKITDTLDQGSNIYISAEDAKPILKAGLNSGDAQIREDAERALENLLRIGRFDFLQIE